MSYLIKQLELFNSCGVYESILGVESWPCGGGSYHKRMLDIPKTKPINELEGLLDALKIGVVGALDTNGYFHKSPKTVIGDFKLCEVHELEYIRQNKILKFVVTLKEILI